MSRSHFVHATAERDDRGHEVGHTLGVEVGERHLLVLVVDLP